MNSSQLLSFTKDLGTFFLQQQKAATDINSLS